MQTRYFRFVEVSPGTPDYETYLALRYEVFCAELNRVHEYIVGAHHRHIETDRFDAFSRHWLAFHIATGIPAACCRFILPNPGGLNVFGRYSVSEWPYPEAKPESTAEISRMAISAHFRRRHSDQGKPVAGDPNDELPARALDEPDERRRHQPELVLGMYREIFLLAGEIGITHAYAAMASNFSRLLLRAGFPFVPVGPVNPSVVPPRRPYLISRDEIVRRLKALNPPLLAFLSGETIDLAPMAA
jgi:N-acyl amino acid synthase of PEP-CTERM/exosortase system